MASQRKWGVDTYSRWDTFEDEESEKPGAEFTPTQFNLGENKIEVRDVSYVEKVVPDKAKVKRILNLKQGKNEVWQVVVRKLRVWSASSCGDDEGEDAIPCRPYSIMINSLYPDGILLLQDICDPPEVFPSAERILQNIVHTCLNPLRGEQRRPKSLTFTDAGLAGELFQSLAEFGIESSHLSESKGVDEIVSKFSQVLIEKDVASVGHTSEHPGMLSVFGVTVPLLRSFYETACKFARLEPWRHIFERQAFELTCNTPAGIINDAKRVTTVPGGTVWVSILGHGSINSKPSMKSAFGIAVFYSRLDLEARVMVPSETIYVRPEEPRCSFTGKTKDEIGRDLKKTKPRKVDIRTGKELLYADAQALRSHWPSVRKFAIELEDLEKGRRERRRHWLGKECTVLYEDITLIPFDDLDMVDQHGFEAVSERIDSLGRFCNPVSLEFQNGEPKRPSAESILWQIRAMKVANELVSCQSPAQPGQAIEIAHSHGVEEGKETIFISPSSVFFESEANAQRESASVVGTNQQPEHCGGKGSEREPIDASENEGKEEGIEDGGSNCSLQ